MGRAQIELLNVVNNVPLYEFVAFQLWLDLFQRICVG